MADRPWLKAGAAVDAYMADSGWQPAVVHSLDKDFGTATLIVNGQTVNCNVFNDEGSIAKAGTYCRPGTASSTASHRTAASTYSYGGYATPGGYAVTPGGYTAPPPYGQVAAYQPYAPMPAIDPEVAAAAAAAGITVTGDDVKKEKKKKKKGVWSSIKSGVSKMMPGGKKKDKPSADAAPAASEAPTTAAAAPATAAAPAPAVSVTVPADGAVATEPQPTPVGVAATSSGHVVDAVAVSADASTVFATPVASDAVADAVVATPVDGYAAAPTDAVSTPYSTASAAAPAPGRSVAELNGLSVGTIHDVKDLFPHKDTRAPMYHWRVGQVRQVDAAGTNIRVRARTLSPRRLLCLA